MSDSVTSSTSSAIVHQNVVPSEVGWQFVPQYYTFVNKQPHRLHCFYTKASTFIHGTEGEDGKPCYGQQEIHSKILSIGFQDCKVFIHSVDAQASAAGGIIIQVIGEMSNRGEAWRKFVQTFFLAEQPSGYFVLNDIFRFLKEESVEDEEADEVADLQPEQPLAQTHVPEVLQPEPEPEPAPTPAVNIPAPGPIEVIPDPVTQELVPEVTTQPIAPEPPKAQPNGVHPEPEKEPEQPAAVEPPAPVEEPTPEVAPAPVREPTPESTPVPPVPNPVPLPQVVSAPPRPAAPPAPKTWANLAAANSKKWGTAVAHESRGTSVEAVTPSPPPSGAQTPVSSRAGQSPAPGRGPHHGTKGNRDSIGNQAAMAVTTPAIFVKGVLEQITQAQLTKALSEFGPLKDVEIVRSRQLAFGEYASNDSAKQAIIASLPTSQGGRGGVLVDVGTDTPIRIYVETKKDKADRPPTRPRGGSPGQGTNDRGGYKSGRGRGRGGVTPAK